MDYYLIVLLGFFAQGLFFLRTIAQWFKSEQEGEVISPIIFWRISLIASIMMLTYGIFDNDITIVIGQYIVYFIYIRNLHLKNAWNNMHITLRIVALIMPFVYLAWLIFGDTNNFSTMINRDDNILKIWGILGQIIFAFRFIYQWIYSENKKDSVLPLGFWIISTAGSLMIFVYSIFDKDIVLFASSGLGLFIYIRNILLHYGKGSLFNRLNEIPVINKLFKKVSGKIK